MHRKLISISAYISVFAMIFLEHTYHNKTDQREHKEEAVSSEKCSGIYFDRLPQIYQISILQGMEDSERGRVRPRLSQVERMLQRQTRTYCISIIVSGYQLQRMKKSRLDAYQEDSEQILKELQRNYLQVLTTLGYGTFGRVKLVKFRGRDEVYALKIMRKQEILEQNQLMHLHSEKEVLLEVSHPNIVALKSTFQDPKHIYMMFEYIQGGELFARLTRNGRFNDHTAMFYVGGVLDAICHLHTHDIVFRDLKPENIMVDSEGFPKLIDLGFAKKLHHLRTFTICGTPQYLAPEMLQKTNKSGYGKAVDYWGIGILIYELLAGYPPFYDNDEPRNIYKKILKGVIELPQFFSLRAKHLILSLLNPNPAKRLGAKNNGDDIKQHPWFRKFDWNDIRNAKVPWKPPIKDPHDATNFEQVSASRGTTVSIPEQDQNLFEGF